MACIVVGDVLATALTGRALGLVIASRKVRNLQEALVSPSMGWTLRKHAAFVNLLLVGFMASFLM